MGEPELARADQELATKLADLHRQINEIDRALADTEARRVSHVMASGGGQVTGIVARPGAMVRAGEPLLTIAPKTGELVAHLFAPSEAIGFVREGARVRVRYRAYPYQKFGQYPGTVAAITGAGSGMGRAMAELFAAEGAQVVCADISGAEETVAAAIGAAALAVRTDVADEAQVEAMVAAALAWNAL